MIAWSYTLSLDLALYTVHDSTAENVAGVVDRKLPWIIRKNGKYRSILDPRYGSEAEADCAALGLNHASAPK